MERTASSADSDALFPGLTVLPLLAVWRSSIRRGHRGRVRMLVAIGLLGVVLSFGPAMPVYGWLFEAVPLLRATRVAARWGILFLTAVAVLAGLGAAALRARAEPPSLADELACLLPALVTLEAARLPLAFTPTPPIPASLHQAGRPAATPCCSSSRSSPAPQFNLNAPYLLAQTVHFHPIVAGYSGFATAAYLAPAPRR